MNEEPTQKLSATTKVCPFPVYLQLVSMDEKTAREHGADGLASRAGQIVTVEISLKLTRREAVPVLAHEISHVIEMVSDIIEDDISGEIRAYLTGWMMEWAFSVFCSWRKR